MENKSQARLENWLNFEYASNPQRGEVSWGESLTDLKYLSTTSAQIIGWLVINSKKEKFQAQATYHGREKLHSLS